MEKAHLQSALTKFLESQRQNSLKMLDCIERVFALEVVLMALDPRAIVLLQQQRDKVHAENQKQREQIDSTFLALQALVSGLPNPPN
jgi:late competence protein required for DNA uptake (superfamily II DNA/RNA helicase)